MRSRFATAALIGLLATSAHAWTMKQAPLMTRWAKDVSPTNALPDYPRPQLVRADWMNLNGLWQFQPGKADDAAPVGKALSGEILVPFATESALSGVMEHHDRLWYRRTFTVPPAWAGRHVILHFDSVDYESEPFLNGQSLGVHKGGYDRFSHDITAQLNGGENELILRVFDPTEDAGQPRGKQTTHGRGIMYTPTTGIWKAPELPKSWYSTDLWTDFAINFIDQGVASKKPFFLYLAYNAPHFPLEAPADEIAKFRGKYMIGWDKLREQRHARQIQQGLVDPAWPLAPRPPDVKAWDSLPTARQEYFDHIMSIYAAVVQHMDIGVGRVMDALKARGIADNTLVLFMSDNGGNAESGVGGRLEGNPPGGPRSTVFEGKSWATLSNTPFRLYKHFNHEGGIATPLIVDWPARVKTPGFRKQPGHVIDIMATCVDVGRATYPTALNGHDILPMEGRSLAPAFDDKPIDRDAIFWEHEGNAAVRVGDWKLARVGDKGEWELHNMVTDRTELHDSSKEEPKIAADLLAKWEAWAKRTHVEPKPGEKAGPNVRRGKVNENDKDSQAAE